MLLKWKKNYKWESHSSSNHAKNEENSFWERWSIIVSQIVKCCLKYVVFGSLLIFPYQITLCWKIGGECLHWNKSLSSGFGSWLKLKGKSLVYKLYLSSLSVLFLWAPQRWTECLPWPAASCAEGRLWEWSSSLVRVCVSCASSTSVFELLNWKVMIFRESSKAHFKSLLLCELFPDHWLGRLSASLCVFFSMSLFMSLCLSLPSPYSFLQG